MNYTKIVAAEVTAKKHVGDWEYGTMNGKEFSGYKNIAVALDTQIYFTNPYCSLGSMDRMKMLMV